MKQAARAPILDVSMVLYHPDETVLVVRISHRASAYRSGGAPTR